VSFRLKLSLAFASILVLTIVVAITSIYGMRRALHHQRELYVFTHDLEKQFKIISLEQHNFSNTEKIQYSRTFFKLSQQADRHLSDVIATLEDQNQKKHVQNLLSALRVYEKSFGRMVQTSINMETIKSRLFHESRRLISNAGAIEKMGTKAVGILKIINKTLEAEKKFMVDDIRSSASKVLHNTNQIIETAGTIKEQNQDSSIQLYAFRIGNVANVYQAVFKEYVNAYDQKKLSIEGMESAFEILEDQLQFYIDFVSTSEKKLVSFLQHLVVLTAVIAIGLGLFAMVSLSKRITSPINDLNQSAQKILEGNFNSQVMVTSKDEIAELGISFNQMARKLEKSFQSLAQHQDHLEDLVQERTMEIKAEIIRHKATQKALEKEKNRALTYFDMAGSILVVLSTDGCITMINKAGRKVLGYRSKEIVGKNWFDVCIPEKIREKTRQVFEEIISGSLEPFEFFENEILTCNGEKRTISWHNSLLKEENGKIIASLSSGEDTTEATRMENERKQLEDQLSQARKMESIGTLAGGIAHDFNNILYPVIGYTELSIADLPNNHPVRANLKHVLKGTLRAKELVRQILTFSRKKEPVQKPIDIRPITKEALKLLRSSIPKNIVMDQTINDEMRPVMADPTQIYEIIMNLSTNAYHAMEQDGGSLTVKLYEDTISKIDSAKPGLKPGVYCVLSIRDTGPGISEDIIDQIFEPYFTTKETGKGSGLGLAVTHGIVKSFGGTIVLKSDIGKGTVFDVFLPVVQDKRSFDSTQKVFERKYGTETILFVDDEKAIVKMGEVALSDLGYKVDGKTNSLQALEVFKSQPDQYDILVTDMTMPGMLGTELIKQVHDIRPDFPVILCTGFSELINKDKADSMGIQGYLKKPVMMSELSYTIRDIIDKANPMEPS